MSETNQKDPADPNAAGGASGDKNPKTESVSREAYERLLDEKKAAAKALADAKKTLDQIAAEKAAKEQADLIAKGEFEKAREADRKRVQELETEAARLKAERTEAKKFGSFVRALGTQIDPKFMPLIDLDNIEADESGNIVESSVTKYVSDFKAQYGVILSKPGSTNIPGAKPQGGGSGVLTYEEWKALPYGKEKKEKMAEVLAARKAGKK